MLWPKKNGIYFYSEQKKKYLNGKNLYFLKVTLRKASTFQACLLLFSTRKWVELHIFLPIYFPWENLLEISALQLLPEE